MGEAASLRKLTAVLAADVAGYSRMMRADQHGTIDKLALRREILDDAVARHQGRIVNTAGDSVLAEFGSVVDALHCALEIQTSVAQENQRLPRERHMSFRIGVHTGEVFVRGRDLLGDGVNVAARLQSLAPPGGIYTSAVVREQVRGILSLQFQNKGQQRLKNIDQPVRVFAVSSAAPGRPVRPDRGGRGLTAARIAALLALCVVAVMAGSVWRAHPSWLEAWLSDSGRTEGQPVAAASIPTPRSARAAPAPPANAAKPASVQPATTTTTGTASASDTIELALWQSALTDGSQAAFEDYLRQYPAGHFAEPARAKIEALKPAPQAETAAVAPVRIPDASAELARGIPFECPKSGTVIAFSDGQRLTFGKRDGFRCRAVAGNGKESDEFAGFVSLSALPSLATEDLQKFWPLKEHAELSFSTRTPEFFSSGQIAQAWVSNRYRVVGTERVHVPAGDFDTIIVERHFLSHAPAIFDSVDVTQRLWYAPKLGYIVKLVSERGTSIYLPAALPAHIEATEVTVP